MPRKGYGSLPATTGLRIVKSLEWCPYFGCIDRKRI